MVKQVSSINPEGDVLIFIENNKSSNCNIKQEEFVTYNPEEMSKKFRQSEKMVELDEKGV